MSRRAPSRSILSACNAALKLALVGLLAFAVVRTDLPQFEGPFVIDMIGNAANLYDTVSWWDDANHLVAVAGSVGSEASNARPKTAPASPALGRFSSLHLQYVTFIGNSPELETAYHDTLGDLTLGLTGSVVTLGRRA